ncbi:hypothetical protein RhiirA4_484443 [Rhizophagus irregularis]|uniref:Uncharacterized protein n=1 Tax=Rhizophagus irregularis TaxID=588596 RepID=A0A2I1HNX2_9GLOM|nr:hypothetical protein RhiirA4_484443 [Rhizophagus irregularis]
MDPKNSNRGPFGDLKRRKRRIGREKYHQRGIKTEIRKIRTLGSASRRDRLELEIIIEERSHGINPQRNQRPVKVEATEEEEAFRAKGEMSGEQVKKCSRVSMNIPQLGQSESSAYRSGYRYHKRDIKVNVQSMKEYEERKGSNRDKPNISKSIHISEKFRQKETGSTRRGTPFRESQTSGENWISSIILDNLKGAIDE